MPLVVVIGLAVVSMPRANPGPEDPVVQGGEWEVSTEPTLVLGTGASGRPLHRVLNAVRLGDGRIVVADGSASSRLSVFSADGRFVHSLSRHGEGPGEIQWVTSLQSGPGDSLFVYDVSLQRLTVLVADGSLGRVAPFRPAAQAPGVGGFERVTRLAKTWVAKEAQSVLPGPIGEIVRDTIVIGHVDGQLGSLRPFAHLPGRMSVSNRVAGRVGVGAPAFTPEVIDATWGNCVFVSTADVPSILVFGADGERIAMFDGPGTPRPVTSEHLAIRLEYDLGKYPDEDPVLLRRLLDISPRPDHLPYYHRMVVDEWGHLWLQEYKPPWGLGSRWYVLSQDGQLLAEVTMPGDLRVFSITEHGVLARAIDDLDVETVRLFPLLSRPSRPAELLPQCVPPGSS